MNNIKNKLSDKLYNMYSSLNPLKPDKNIIEFCEFISSIAKHSINIDSKNERYVAFGYYSADIKVNVGKFFKLEPDILFINALRIELFLDFLCFVNNSTMNHFIYFFSKYMRNIEYTNKNLNAASFYNWLYTYHKENAEPNSYKYVNLAVAGSMFFILHELAHKQEEIVDSTIKMFHTPPTDVHFETVRENDLKEVACDFTALVYMEQLNSLKNPLHCTMDEIVEVALVNFFLDAVYKELTNFLNNNINSSAFSTKTMFSELPEITNNRFKNLSIAIKVAHNGNMYFSQVNMSGVINKVSIMMQKYLKFFSEFIQKELFAKVNEYNIKSEAEQKKYYINNDSSSWFLFS